MQMLLEKGKQQWSMCFGLVRKYGKRGTITFDPKISSQENLSYDSTIVACAREICSIQSFAPVISISAGMFSLQENRKKRKFEQFYKILKELMKSVSSKQNAKTW